MSAADAPWGFKVNSWADLPAAIATTQQAGAIGTAHLLRSLMLGRIALLPLSPDMSATKIKYFIRHARRPATIMLIGDDDGLDRGPAGWPLAERAVRWAAGCLVHATGAQVAHYESAIRAAEIVGRVLIIECSTATEDAWMQVVATAPNRPGGLLIRSASGPHPIPLDRGQVQ